LAKLSISSNLHDPMSVNAPYHVFLKTSLLIYTYRKYEPEVTYSMTYVRYITMGFLSSPCLKLHHCKVLV